MSFECWSFGKGFLLPTVNNHIVFLLLLAIVSRASYLMGKRASDKEHPAPNPTSGKAARGGKHMNSPPHSVD